MTVILTRAGITTLPALTLPRSPRVCPACAHDLTTFEGIGQHNTRAAWTGERTYRGTLAPAPMSKHWHQGEGRFA
ncbi:MAG TPA: hypothetical protein VFM71_11445 [Gemmatimonadaceae bacterium]|nr:hypothetical protein [Gemmatimonadaceae bacterium]